jgi:hypothetical protein
MQGPGTCSVAEWNRPRRVKQSKLRGRLERALRQGGTRGQAKALKMDDADSSPLQSMAAGAHLAPDGPVRQDGAAAYERRHFSDPGAGNTSQPAEYFDRLGSEGQNRCQIGAQLGSKRTYSVLLRVRPKLELLRV